MKIAIVGSRDYPNLKEVVDYVYSLSPDTVIVSGGANGVDQHAEWAAIERGMKVEIYYPDWKRHGKSAGFIRNEQIVKAADMVVAFWDGKSKGTAHSINLAQKFQKSLQVITP